MHHAWHLGHGGVFKIRRLTQAAVNDPEIAARFLWARQEEPDGEDGAVGFALQAQFEHNVYWIRRFLEDLARGYNARRA